jgi:hypothetical protein
MSEKNTVADSKFSGSTRRPIFSFSTIDLNVE